MLSEWYYTLAISIESGSETRLAYLQDTEGSEDPWWDYEVSDGVKKYQTRPEVFEALARCPDPDAFAVKIKLQIRKI